MNNEEKFIIENREHIIKLLENQIDHLHNIDPELFEKTYNSYNMEKLMKRMMGEKYTGYLPLIGHHEIVKEYPMEKHSDTIFYLKPVYPEEINIDIAIKNEPEFEF